LESNFWSLIIALALVSERIYYAIIYISVFGLALMLNKYTFEEYDA